MQQLKIVMLSRLPLLLIMFFIGLFYPNFLKISSFFGITIPEDLPSYDFKKIIIKRYRRDFSLVCGGFLLLFTIILLNNNTDSIFTKGLIVFAVIWIIVFNISQKRTKDYIKDLTSKTSKSKNNKANYNKISSPNKTKSKALYLLSPLYFIIPLIISIIMLILNLTRYEKLPLRIPMFWNLSGQFPILITKGYDIVLIYPIIALILIIIFLSLYKNINLNNNVSTKVKKALSIFFAYCSIITSIIILLFDLVSISFIVLAGTILMTMFYAMMISIIIYGLYIYTLCK